MANMDDDQMNGPCQKEPCYELPSTPPLFHSIISHDKPLSELRSKETTFDPLTLVQFEQDHAETPSTVLRSSTFNMLLLTHSAFRVTYTNESIEAVSADDVVGVSILTAKFDEMLDTGSTMRSLTSTATTPTDTGAVSLDNSSGHGGTLLRTGKTNYAPKNNCHRHHQAEDSNVDHCNKNNSNKNNNDRLDRCADCYTDRRADRCTDHPTDRSDNSRNCSKVVDVDDGCDYNKAAVFDVEHLDANDGNDGIGGGNGVGGGGHCRGDGGGIGDRGSMCESDSVAHRDDTDEPTRPRIVHHMHPVCGILTRKNRRAYVPYEQYQLQLNELIFRDKFFNEQNHGNLREAYTTEAPMEALRLIRNTRTIPAFPSPARYAICEIEPTHNLMSVAFPILFAYVRDNRITRLAHRLSPRIAWIADTFSHYCEQRGVLLNVVKIDLTASKIQICRDCVDRENHTSATCEICLFHNYAAKVRSLLEKSLGRQRDPQFPRPDCRAFITNIYP